VKRVILLLFWTKRGGTQTLQLKEIRNRFVLSISKLILIIKDKEISFWQTRHMVVAVQF
jgi:hypothetical protein